MKARRSSSEVANLAAQLSVSVCVHARVDVSRVSGVPKSVYGVMVNTQYMCVRAGALAAPLDSDSSSIASRNASNTFSDGDGKGPSLRIICFIRSVGGTIVSHGESITLAHKYKGSQHHFG